MTGIEHRPLLVAVLFGGRSAEHEVSCASALGVMQALRACGHDIVALGISRAGRWSLVDSERALDQADAAGLTVDEAFPGAPEVALSPDGLAVVDEAGFVRRLGRPDVVFPVLHGPYGEDGSVQGLLDLVGLPYVGSGVLASAVCMDKEFTKRLMRAAGLPVGRYAVLRPGHARAEAEVAVEGLALPAFVKPARSGSSLGISKIGSWSELDDAVARARQFDPKVLIEDAVVGREISCGVLGRAEDASIETSPLAETIFEAHDWYDYDAKYTDPDCKVVVPADMPEDVAVVVRSMTRAAFLAMDCRDLARVDFFVGDDGTVTLSEVNTMPGFTADSIFPLMWQCAGLSYQALIDRIVRGATAPLGSPGS